MWKKCFLQNRNDTLVFLIAVTKQYLQSSSQSIIGRFPFMPVSCFLHISVSGIGKKKC